MKLSTLDIISVIFQWPAHNYPTAHGCNIQATFHFVETALKFAYLSPFLLTVARPGGLDGVLDIAGHREFHTQALIHSYPCPPLIGDFNGAVGSSVWLLKGPCHLKSCWAAGNGIVSMTGLAATSGEEEDKVPFVMSGPLPTAHQNRHLCSKKLALSISIIDIKSDLNQQGSKSY